MSDSFRLSCPNAMVQSVSAINPVLSLLHVPTHASGDLVSSALAHDSDHAALSRKGG